MKNKAQPQTLLETGRWKVSKEAMDALFTKDDIRSMPAFPGRKMTNQELLILRKKTRIAKARAKK